MSTPRWLELLRADVAVSGSIQASADRIGVSRAAVSTALAGRYPASTHRLEAKVLAALERVQCPYLRAELTPGECQGFRERSMPRSSPERLNHWACCQSCEIGRRLAAAEKGGGHAA